MNYYTPTPEEFHIGFEYELRTAIRWKQKTFDFNYFPNIVDDFREDLEEGSLRVKYLDQADIESLGWEKRVSFINGYVIEKEDKLLYLTTYEKTPLLIILVEYKDNSDREYLFQGHIKNKSELKRIMTQLKINE